MGEHVEISGAASRPLDVVCCGEVLIDLVATEAGLPLSEVAHFERAAGGAPANVAVGMARLGHRSGFLGQVGDDDFGRFLSETLRGEGVDIGGLSSTEEARTALAFVSLRSDGERDFLFYRSPSADMLWRLTSSDARLAAQSRIFHFGSISLIAEPSRGSTLAAAESARRSGALLSYDPNLRLALWPSPRAARDAARVALRSAQIVKLSHDELAFLTGQYDGNLERAARSLWHHDLQLLVVTQGANGCRWFSPDGNGDSPPFSVRAIDTTGAGDAFMAGMLAGLLETGLVLERETIEAALRLANATGALTTTRRGAIPALPSRAAAERLLNPQP